MADFHVDLFLKFVGMPRRRRLCQQGATPAMVQRNNEDRIPDDSGMTFARRRNANVI
jgi:hypothetical protein